MPGPNRTTMNGCMPFPVAGTAGNWSIVIGRGNPAPPTVATPHPVSCIASLGPLLTALSMRSRTLQFAFPKCRAQHHVFAAYFVRILPTYRTITHTHIHTSGRTVLYYTMRSICLLPLAGDSVSQKLATPFLHVTPTHPRILSWLSPIQPLSLTKIAAEP